MTDHDDEVTTDVDPAWIEAIRAETARAAADDTPSPDADATPADADGDATDGHDGDGAPGADAATTASPADWFDTELQWDAEATVGVTSGLLDRIRAEIDTDHASPSPEARTASPTPPAAPAPSAPSPTPDTTPPPAPSAPSPTPDTTPPPAPPAAPAFSPPAPTPVPVAPAEEAASTTLRWEPRQRLNMSAPVKESAAIVDTSTHHGLDRTKIIIAVIVAITVVLVVWLISQSGGDGGDDPPEGTVPASSVAGLPAPELDDDAGAGG